MAIGMKEHAQDICPDVINIPTLILIAYLVFTLDIHDNTSQ